MQILRDLALVVSAAARLRHARWHASNRNLHRVGWPMALASSTTADSRDLPKRMPRAIRAAAHWASTSSDGVWCRGARWPRQPPFRRRQEAADDGLRAGPRRQILALPKNLPGAARRKSVCRHMIPSILKSGSAPSTDCFRRCRRCRRPFIQCPDLSERQVAVADLENLAIASSPMIRQAQADITAARGNAIQVGTHPNPTIGYESRHRRQLAEPELSGGILQSMGENGRQTAIGPGRRYDRRAQRLSWRCAKPASH